jgi:hypothetical protein
MIEHILTDLHLKTCDIKFCGFLPPFLYLHVPFSHILFFFLPFFLYSRLIFFVLSFHSSIYSVIKFGSSFYSAPPPPHPSFHPLFSSLSLDLLQPASSLRLLPSSSQRSDLVSVNQFALYQASLEAYDLTLCSVFTATVFPLCDVLSD